MVCAGSAVAGRRWLLALAAHRRGRVDGGDGSINHHLSTINHLGVPGTTPGTGMLPARFAYFGLGLGVLRGEMIEIASQYVTLRLTCKSKYCNY